jgi:hypothetical protein
VERAGQFRGMCICAAVLLSALVPALAPSSASATSPVLEFVAPGSSFPIPFEGESANVNARLGEFDRIVECSHGEGEGEVTDAHTTVSSYAFTGCVAEVIGGGGTSLNCTSEGAASNEIRSKTIEADPVYLGQAKHEVAMLLNPDGGIYMEFECGTNEITASGPFLAPVNPVNVLTDSFTAVLNRNGNSQIPTEYEDLNGEKHQAIPEAVVNGGEPDTSGVDLSFSIQTNVPLEIKAVSKEEIEARRHAEEEAAAKKRQEEEAAKKRQEEEVKKHQEEVKKHQEEEAARKRAQHRAKALKHCRKAKSKHKRVQCEKRVKRKYGAPGAPSKYSATSSALLAAQL